MKKIKFTIVIPAYNRADRIVDTVESILQQDYDNFEVIIVDDGSTDGTDTVIKKIKDSRVKYVWQENSERGASRNHGTRLATGDYVVFMDSDDLLYKNHLSAAKKFIEKNNAQVFFQQCDFLTENGKRTSNYTPRTNPFNEELVRESNFIACQGMFLKREIALANKFDEDRQLAASEDYELWLRIASRYPILFSKEVTSTVILHDERSVVTTSPDKLILRKELMLQKVFNDAEFNSKFSKYKSRMKAEAYSYIALHLILVGEKEKAKEYLKKGLQARVGIVLKKRFWAILIRLF